MLPCDVVFGLTNVSLGGAVHVLLQTLLSLTCWIPYRTAAIRSSTLSWVVIFLRTASQSWREHFAGCLQIATAQSKWRPLSMQLHARLEPGGHLFDIARNNSLELHMKPVNFMTGKPLNARQDTSAPYWHCFARKARTPVTLLRSCMLCMK